MKQPDNPIHQQALELAEAGQYEQAFNLMQKRLSQDSQDAEALNDTAVLLHCLNRSDESIDYLMKARQIDPDSTEVLWNLVEAYLAEAQVDQAMALLNDMETRGILGFDVLNRAADICINEDKLTQARNLLDWSLRLEPNQEILKPMIEVIDAKIKTAP